MGERWEARCTNCARLWQAEPRASNEEARTAMATAGWSGEAGYLLCKRCKEMDDPGERHQGDRR